MNTEQSYINVRISQDEMEAYVSINLPKGSPIPQSEDIISAIIGNNIKMPILSEKIEKIINDKILNEEVLISIGKAVKPSQNGRIELLYKRKKEISPEGKESIDHRSRNSIETVSKGEEIAKLHPPIEGTEGITVTGRIINPGTGKAKILKNGKNTEFSSQDSNILLSTENGAVRFVDNKKIFVESVMNVRGDVDYAVGNIDFTGSLIIQGNVLSGFTVRAAGSIQINGTIEDAEVIAGGDVIANGCSGKNKGVIRAGGKIHIKFAEGHKLQAYGNISVEKYLMNCKCQSDGKIFFTKKNGLIVGGETLAAIAIETEIAGNTEGSKTVLAAGFSSELRQKLIMLDLDQKKNINSLGTVNQVLKRISRIAILKKDLSQEMKQQIRELIKTKETIEERIQELTNEQSELLMENELTESSSISIKNTAHPGVTIRFPDAQKMIRETLSNVKFKPDDHGIMTLSAL